MKTYFGERGVIWKLLNKDIKEFNTIILSLFCIFLLFCTGLLSYKITSSHALFKNTIKGKKTLSLKVEALEIGLTKAKIKLNENGGTELTKSSYEKNKTGMHVSLPNKDSSVTYEMRITAPENKSYNLSEIIVEEYTNNNIKYEIEGISIGDKIEANQSILFTIKFYYDGEINENTETKLTLKYEFVDYIETYVVKEYYFKNNYEAFKAPYDGEYKIELWGTQCGGIYGGLGGYTSGVIALNKDKEQYIYVGEQQDRSDFDIVFNGGGVTKHKTGGGSGYYGGGSSAVTRSRAATGAGGSSFISGHNGCNAIDKASTNDNIIHTGQSIHYSNYKFTNTTILDGNGYNWTTTKENNTQMPTYDGISTMIGNSGNGHAKITFIERTY